MPFSAWSGPGISPDELSVEAGLEEEGALLNLGAQPNIKEKLTAAMIGWMCDVFNIFHFIGFYKPPASPIQKFQDFQIYFLDEGGDGLTETP